MATRAAAAAVLVAFLALAGQAIGAEHRRVHRSRPRVAAPADVPPLGIPIDTIYGPRRAVRIGDREYAPFGEEADVHLVTVDRATLEVTAHSYADDAQGLENAKHEVSQLDDRTLVILALPDSELGERSQRVLNDVLAEIGATPFEHPEPFGFSAVGVRGWKKGAAYHNLNGEVGAPDAEPGDLHGYLEKALSTGSFGFVFSDYTPIATQVKPPSGERTAMMVGHRTVPSFGFQDPKYSGFQVVALDQYSGRIELNRTFETNGAGAALDQAGQEALGRTLQSVRPFQVALVQSFGSPDPTTIGWNAIADGIAHLGGTRPLIDDVNGHHQYALVGSPSSPAQTTESFQDKESGQAGVISALLARDHAARFQALLPDPSGLEGSNQLLEIAYRAPTPWPLRDTDSRRAAIQYIAGQLELKVADPRERYRDLNIHWSDAEHAGRLRSLRYPGSSEFGEADFEAVKAELLKEFGWVTAVRTYVDNMHDVLADSVIVKQAAMKKVVEDLRNVASSGVASLNSWQIAEIVVKIGAKLAEIGQPEVAPVMEAVAGGLSLAGKVAGPNGDPILDRFDATIQELADKLIERYRASLDSLNLLRSLVVTDGAKLAFAGQAIEEQKPGWKWDDETISATRQALLLGMTRLIYVTLLRIPYVTYRLPGDFQNPSDCRVLGGEPANAWLSHTDRFVMEGGKLRRQTTAWAIGTRTEDDRYGRMKPDATVIKELFDHIPSDLGVTGLGEFKPTFIARTLDVRDLPRVNCITR